MLFNLGPLWYFIGINQLMCKNRRIELGLKGITTDKNYPYGYVPGLELYGCDTYPHETTEDLIKQSEQREKFFIIRNGS